MRKRRVVGRNDGMKYNRKDHKDRTQEQNKKEWASSVGLCLKDKSQYPHHVKVSPRGLGGKTETGDFSPLILYYHRHRARHGVRMRQAAYWKVE